MRSSNSSTNVKQDTLIESLDKAKESGIQNIFALRGGNSLL